MDTLSARTGIRKYVGLDVHAHTTWVAVADAGGGEVREVGATATELVSLGKVLERLGTAEQLWVVYEAGPTGYGLYHGLRARGYGAAVIAPSLVPRAPGERIKTDRRDARKLARLARAGELCAITVPEPCDEAVRDVSRAREDAVAARLRLRQQVSALLLRHSERYAGTRWTASHRRWLQAVRLPYPAQQALLEDGLAELVAADATVLRRERLLREAVAGWRWSATVDALMTLRGVAWLTAVTLVAELGDIRRFAHPRELMAFLGLVPSEHSSGPRQRRGAITRAGNGHARRLLVEAAWQYRHRVRVSKALQARLDAQPAAQQQLSWKAQERLCSRYRRLSARGLHPNKICVAVARELAGFVWALARGIAPANEQEVVVT